MLWIAGLPERHKFWKYHVQGTGYTKLKCQHPGEPISSLYDYATNDSVKLLMQCLMFDIISHASFSVPKNHGIANIFCNKPSPCFPWTCCLSETSDIKAFIYWLHWYHESSMCCFIYSLRASHELSSTSQQVQLYFSDECTVECFAILYSFAVVYGQSLHLTDRTCVFKSLRVLNAFLHSEQWYGLSSGCNVFMCAESRCSIPHPVSQTLQRESVFLLAPLFCSPQE